MRTRNSWRNQDILFRALFKPADPPPVEPAEHAMVLHTHI